MKARLKIYNNYIGNDIPDNSEQVEIVFQSSTGGGGSAGTLNTANTAAQTAVASEPLSGEVSLHKVSKTGSYTDLNNKPTIPVAQVNSDWNAASGVAQILNKPTIPAAQVNSDWDAVRGVAQILNKPTIPDAPGVLHTVSTRALEEQ
jgi:hypothetical protein